MSYFFFENFEYNRNINRDCISLFESCLMEEDQSINVEQNPTYKQTEQKVDEILNKVKDDPKYQNRNFIMRTISKLRNWANKEIILSDAKKESGIFTAIKKLILKAIRFLTGLLDDSKLEPVSIISNTKSKIEKTNNDNKEKSSIEKTKEDIERRIERKRRLEQEEMESDRKDREEIESNNNFMKNYKEKMNNIKNSFAVRSAEFDEIKRKNSSRYYSDMKYHNEINRKYADVIQKREERNKKWS